MRKLFCCIAFQNGVLHTIFLGTFITGFPILIYGHTVGIFTVKSIDFARNLMKLKAKELQLWRSALAKLRTTIDLRSRVRSAEWRSGSVLGP